MVYTLPTEEGLGQSGGELEELRERVREAELGEGTEAVPGEETLGQVLDQVLDPWLRCS